MNTDLPNPEYNKLTVIYRIEPGCLGPNGAHSIDEFCISAQKEIESYESDVIQWEISPRNDKSLPEIQYKIQSKFLTPEQAARYLAILDKRLGKIEDCLHDQLTQLIDRHLER